MNLAEVLAEIQKALPTADVSRVVVALRQDPLVWASLQNESFLQNAILYCGKLPERWSPANLALVSLGKNMDIHSLNESLLVSLEGNLRERALETYDQVLGSSRVPATLAEAGLVALALRENHKLTNSWDGLLDELSPEKGIGIQFSIWQTPLACVFGMIDDSSDMLWNLLTGQVTHSHLSLVSQIILSNPIRPQDRMKIFLEVMDALSLSQQLTWLRLLNLQGHAELVIQLADKLLVDSKTTEAGILRDIKADDDLSKTIQGSLALQQLAGLFQLSGQPEKALQLLQKSKETVLYCLAGLHLQLLDVSTQGDQTEEALALIKKSVSGLPNPGHFLTEIALSMDNTPRAKDLRTALMGKSDNPFVQLKQAGWLAEKGEQSQAQSLGRKAVGLLVEKAAKGEQLFSAQFLLNWYPAAWIKSLIDLGLLQEALQLALLFLTMRPVDKELIELISVILQNLGDNGQALGYAEICSVLNPDDPDLIRKIAELWEKFGDWGKSFDQRRKVIKLIDQPSREDWLGFARSAVGANEPRYAVEGCAKVIEQEPENLESNSLMGKALVQLGRKDDATQYLKKAISLSPSDKENWLVLADLQKKNGETQQSLETLHLAINAVPDNVDIHRQIAQLWEQLNDWQKAFDHRNQVVHLSQAPVEDDLLTYARSAYETRNFHQTIEACEKLVDSNAENGMAKSLMGQALYQLGDYDKSTNFLKDAVALCPEEAGNWITLTDLQNKKGEIAEAMNTLQSAVEVLPQDIEINRRLAENLERIDNWQKAFIYRERVLHLSLPPQPTDYIDYARCALNIDQPGDAIEACTKVLEKDNDHGQANAIMGKALYHMGDPEKAMEYLSRATLFLPGEAESWLLLSDLQFQSSDPQRSLETLRSAALAAPNSVMVNLALAEASIAVGLVSEALPFLQQATKLAPESVDISIRLGNALFALKRYEEAKASLEQALPKWPLEADLALIYAKVMLALGDTGKALPALEIVVQNGNNNFDVFLLYVKALLGDKYIYLSRSPYEDFTGLVNAQHALEKAQKIDPDDFETRLLYAEVLGARGEGAQAFDLYQQLVDHPMANLGEWHWRVMGGFGKIALQQQAVETALAVLKEAVQSRPENIVLQSLLAEALLSAQLTEEAMQTARIALRLATNDIANLSWFADIATRSGEVGEAVEALVCLTELDPDRAEYWILLAEGRAKIGDEDGARKTLNSLMGVEQISTDLWIRIAHVFLQLGDKSATLSSLDHAVKQDDGQTIELLFELACLQASMGDSEAALYSSQKAIELSPADAVFQVFEADLLMQLKRPQAAQACLERALTILDTGSTVEPIDHYRGLIKTALVTEEWLESIQTKAGIHIRIAHLLRLSGNLSSALFHAEKALEHSSGNLACRFFTVDTALALLQNDNVVQSLVHLDGGGNDLEIQKRRNPGAWAGILAYQAEWSLDAGEEVNASRLITDGLEFAPANLRMQAAQARLLARQGQMKSAEEVFGRITATQLTHEKNDAPMITDFLGDDLVNFWQNGREIWKAEAAFDLFHWDDALNIFEGIISFDGYHGRAYLLYARSLVLCGEKKRLFNEVGCVKHAPAIDMLSKNTFEKMENALASAWQISNGKEIKRWHTRGHMVFQLTPQSIQALDKLSDVLDDKAAIAAALRQSKNFNLAMDIALRLPETPDFLIQQALCCLKNNPAAGLEYAKQASGCRPTDPICNGVLALLAQEEGNPVMALDALESALQVWDDEPEWHARAARISSDKGMLDISLQHWKQAFWLQPTNIEYALALGGEYLNQNDPEKAIQVLENASQISPDRVATWLLLSDAHQRTGNLASAFECAQRADQFDPTSSLPALVCGEICVAMGNFEKAKDYASVALTRDPDNLDAALFMSNVLQKQGKFQEALTTLENVPKEYQVTMQVFYERVKLTRQIKGSQTALPLIEELDKLYPDDPQVLGLLSVIQVDCDDLAGAEQNALAALRLQPENPGLNLLLGRLMHRSGQLDTAIYYLSEAIAQGPKKIEVYIELGATYQERRELLQALQVYEKGIKAVPDEPRLYYAAALVMREIKDYVGAEAMLRKASELSPDDLNIRRQLGAVIALNLVHNPQEANSYQ